MARNKPKSRLRRNFSFDPRVYAFAKERAKADNRSVSNYLAGLVLMDRKRCNADRTWQTHEQKH